jgi:hypothetical protein
MPVAKSTCSLVGMPFVVSLAVADKAAKVGHPLTEREVRRLEEYLERDCSEEAVRRFRLRCKGPPHGKVTLTVDGSDLQRIVKAAKAAVTSPTLVGNLVTSSSTQMMRKLQQGWPRERKHLRRERESFRRHIGRLWGRVLDKLDFLLKLTRAIAEERQGLPEPLPEEAQTRGVLLRLHARSCQVADEALVLLRHGFADGAHARWRTLHEIAVVATFIAERGEAVAERYLAHVAVETCRGADRFQKYSRRLGDRRLSKREMTRNEGARAAVVSKYGPDFKNAYGWAADALGNPNPNFSDIEEAVRLEHVRPLYQLASHNVHAGAKGAMFRLGLSQELNELNSVFPGYALRGPSDEGLTDAIAGVSWSLMLVTTSLLQWKPTMDVLVLSQMLVDGSQGVKAALDEVEARRQLRRQSKGRGRRVPKKR